MIVPIPLYQKQPDIKLSNQGKNKTRVYIIITS